MARRLLLGRRRLLLLRRLLGLLLLLLLPVLRGGRARRGRARRRHRVEGRGWALPLEQQQGLAAGILGQVVQLGSGGMALADLARRRCGALLVVLLVLLRHGLGFSLLQRAGWLAGWLGLAWLGAFGVCCCCCRCCRCWLVCRAGGLGESGRDGWRARRPPVWAGRANRRRLKGVGTRDSCARPRGAPSSSRLPSALSNPRGAACRRPSTPGWL
mmetsp:Transcript_12163/g.34400  ORF Transcript_12163/g.34400 Transcript_12163/m.34400 type:complete len:214 (-) Transcript_12163:1395-2036(-)